MSKSVFPEAARIAIVSPVNQGTSNKNGISNFRLGVILTMFSKMYERVTKKLIDKAMNQHLSPFISGYQQNYSTQYVLIVVGGVFMDLSKAFDCIKVLMTI